MDTQWNVEDRGGNKVTTFHIPQTKIMPKERGGETVFWAHQEGLADPEAALLNHLEVNQPPQLAHLFAYWHGSTHRPLTKPIFLAHLKKALKDAGRPMKHGHSIRIGATLEYLLRGVPFEAMKSIGRWSSDSFSKYLRKHAKILAPYVQANPDLHQRISHKQTAVIPSQTTTAAPHRLHFGSLPAHRVGEQLPQWEPQLAGPLCSGQARKHQALCPLCRYVFSCCTINKVQRSSNKHTPN